MNRDLELLLSFLTPIAPLLLDDSVTEIMGNPDGHWWYEKQGLIHRAESVTFYARNLHTGLEVIANKLGKKLDRSSLILNAQLPDGSLWPDNAVDGGIIVLRSPEDCGAFCMSFEPRAAAALRATNPLSAKPGRCA